MKRAALIALVLLAAFTQAASAAPGFRLPVPLEVQRTAERLAVAHWQALPSEQPVVTWTHLGRRPGYIVNAASHWTAFKGDPASAFTDLSIEFSYDVGWNWPKFCTVMIHEYGHLLGHPHSDNPNDVMAPYYSRPAPECAQGKARWRTR